MLLGVARETVRNWFAKPGSIGRSAITSTRHDARVKIPPKARPIIREGQKRGEIHDGKGRVKKGCSVQPLRLADIGVEKTQAHRAEQLADIPAKAVEKHLLPPCNGRCKR